MLKKILNFVPELISRFVIGFIFIESGWGKFHDLSKVAMYFESLGIPYARLQAPFVSVVELVAGIFILIGFKMRFSSIPLIGIMLVAIKTAKWDEISDLSSLFGVSEFLYLIILIWLLIQEPKFLSVDFLITKFQRNKIKFKNN